MDIKNLTPVELMNTYADILDELNKKSIIRTYNSPVGDYAEWLVSNQLKLKLETNSNKGYDAFDEERGLKYQIKCRWERGHANLNSRGLSVIRDFDGNAFDFLIAVIFDRDFNVKEVYKIPYDVVKKYSIYSKHVNGYRLRLTGSLLSDPNVENVVGFFKELRS